MNERKVLEILFQTINFLTPDEICGQLRKFHARKSVYSYLFRLHKEGLLLRGRTSSGCGIAYQISSLGIERIKFLNCIQEGGISVENDDRAPWE
jgi:hypothetical protein